MADVVEVLRRAGGRATFAQLTGLTSARSIRTALAAGEIRRVAKDTYALAEDASPLTVALAHGGVLSHESAALYWGFDVLKTPSRPHVTLRRGRLRRRSALPAHLHWSDTAVLDHATTPLRTVLDCARSLPFAEGLAVADSALRRGEVNRSELESAALALRGAGRSCAVRVAAAADGRAESALESALRAQVIDAGFEGFIPQLVIGDADFQARVDLADPVLRIVLEADSFAHHASRKDLRRDCRRYVNLSMRGWILLRFSWEDVMIEHGWVAEALEAVTRGRPALHNPAEEAA